MLIEIKKGGQHASMNPDHIVRAVSSAGRGGWLAVVTMSGGPGGAEGFDTVFGPFGAKAAADDIVRRVTEAANEVQAVERESVFVEFINNNGMRTAVNRAMATSIHIWPGASEQREPAWQVCIGLCAAETMWTSFTTDRAEADELFDRLTR
jgi:hypothetical protein